MKRTAYSVGQVNAYIKNMFAQDFLLHNICVKGEVSNCKYHTSGHIYFTIKDEKAAMSAIMFSGSRSGLDFQMQKGDKVLVTGSIEVYERDGAYQIYARKIEKDGEGSLFLRFEALKRELSEMGMFADEYKKPIPKYVLSLGIVTSSTGAALQDIRNIAARRNPYAQLVLYSALVQGDGAAESIVKGIRALDGLGLDAIIVGRGGGSIEDLWAFNEEIVARAIFDCQTPVISAVGHETDTTIADYAADLRAPTPSAAAELALFQFSDLMEEIRQKKRELDSSMAWKLEAAKNRCHHLERLLQSKNPRNQIHQGRQYALLLEEKLERAMKEKLKQMRHRLELLAGRLDGASPAKKLGGGMAYLLAEDGTRIFGAMDVSVGALIRARLKDGTVTARVTAVTPDAETREGE
ncbi:MAG: exodeoxyribonuclease VII large subunit [Eubacterium sp.]|jgi:exodeoxyribonuclease VII large subunit|nr:exodeoxyribonuclease VII large subunit [Eubacterium sp.]